MDASGRVLERHVDRVHRLAQVGRGVSGSAEEPRRALADLLEHLGGDDPLGDLSDPLHRPTESGSSLGTGGERLGGARIAAAYLDLDLVGHRLTSSNVDQLARAARWSYTARHDCLKPPCRLLFP